MMISTMDSIQQHADQIKNGEHDKIGPGVPIALSTALVAGEGIAQGDLMLIVADGVPSGYQKVNRPNVADKQLVPGNTVGAKHCLDSLKGVTLYRPEVWTEESLDGPCIVATLDRVVLHPTHGAVTIPAGMTIVCHYQREFDAEKQRERRAAD